jgi:hypothetical protein
MFDLGTIWIKLNYFVLTNRQDLKKWWVLILIAVAIFSTVFVITNAVVYVINLPKQDALINSIAASPLDYAAIRAEQKPLELTLADAVVLPASLGKYNAVVKATNPNKNWAATEVTYEFAIGGQSTGELTETVMPNAVQYLTAYNIRGPDASSGVTASMSVKHVTWVRIPDPSTLPKADFAYTDLDFGSSVTKTGLTVYRVTGQATNNSFSGFWRVKLQVVLLNDGAIVGINTVFLEKFLQGETRPIYTQWDAVSGSVGTISVVHAMNLLDTANLIR